MKKIDRLLTNLQINALQFFIFGFTKIDFEAIRGCIFKN